MAIRGEDVTEGFLSTIENKKQAQLELAETMIRKYWGHEQFNSLNGDEEILAFAKKFADKIDKLESLTDLIGDEFLKDGLVEAHPNKMFDEHKNRISLKEKLSVLSPARQNELILSMDEKTAELIGCLLQNKLDAYFLIAHNEGLEKAEEARNGDDGIMKSSVEYRRNYDPMPKAEGMPEKKKFSEVILGGTSKAA